MKQFCKLNPRWIGPIEKHIDNGKVVFPYAYAFCESITLNGENLFVTPDNEKPGRGHFIKDWNPEITLHFPNKWATKKVDVLDRWDWLIVSKRFVEVLAPFVTNEIQYLPVKIDSNEPLVKEGDYVVANVVNVIDDKEYKVSLLNRRVMKSQNIFLITEGYGIYTMYVSKDIADAIENAELKGVDIGNPFSADRIRADYLRYKRDY